MYSKLRKVVPPSYLFPWDVSSYIRVLLLFMMGYILSLYSDYSSSSLLTASTTGYPFVSISGVITVLSTYNLSPGCNCIHQYLTLVIHLLI